MELFNSQSCQSQTFKLTPMLCKTCYKAVKLMCGNNLLSGFSCLQRYCGSSHFFDITFCHRRPNSSILIKLVGNKEASIYVFKEWELEAGKLKSS